MRCGASRTCWKTELGMAGSGCLWQTPFCSLRRSSLPFSPILSALSPPSRQMVIATSHVAALHCDATRPPPSSPFVRERAQPRPFAFADLFVLCPHLRSLER